MKCQLCYHDTNNVRMRWGMIVRLSFLRKSILDPKIFMCDCVFVDGCLSQFLL